MKKVLVSFKFITGRPFKGGKRELPFNLEQDRDSGNLILNYFYIKELKKKKI